jgi:hypothetical protein
MISNKRGQSALEYLMTYGWALIVIVAVIAALYFIIPKTSTTCTGLTNNMTIKGYKLDNTGLQVEIANGSGKTITNVSLTATRTSGSGDLSPATHSGSVSPGESFTLSLTGTPSGNVAYNLNLGYNDGTFDQNATGSCSGQV